MWSGRADVYVCGGCWSSWCAVKLKRVWVWRDENPIMVQFCSAGSSPTAPPSSVELAFGDLPRGYTLWQVSNGAQVILLELFRTEENMDIFWTIRPGCSLFPKLCAPETLILPAWGELNQPAKPGSTTLVRVLLGPERCRELFQKMQTSK